MTTIDITKAIAPKSDQLNADDLLAGPRTIRIRDVKVSQGEQPVSVFFDNDEGRPWKPGKTAMRCLAELMSYVPVQSAPGGSTSVAGASPPQRRRSAKRTSRVTPSRCGAKPERIGIAASRVVST